MVNLRERHTSREWLGPLRRRAIFRLRLDYAGRSSCFLDKWHQAIEYRSVYPSTMSTSAECRVDLSDCASSRRDSTSHPHPMQEQEG